MTIKKTKIDMVRITGKVEEKTRARDYIDRNGYSIMQSGPRINRGDGPTIDTSRFVIVAEKEVA